MFTILANHIQIDSPHQSRSLHENKSSLANCSYHELEMPSPYTHLSQQGHHYFGVFICKDYSKCWQHSYCLNLLKSEQILYVCPLKYCLTQIFIKTSCARSYLRPIRNARLTQQTNA